MSPPGLSELSSAILVERLVRLAGEERAVQAAFLVHLDEFERRRGYADAGHDSLWNWCVRVLHLSEGAAGRRISAMRVVRRFPRVLDAFREGRLSLSTVSLLSQVLTPENADDLVARASFRTKAEVDHLVASIRPRHAPTNGIRRVGAGARPSTASSVTGFASAGPSSARSGSPATAAFGDASPVVSTPAPAPPLPASDARTHLRIDSQGRYADSSETLASCGPERARARADLRPVSRDEWSVRVTIDAQCREELETLRHLLSHKCGSDLASVLREAIRCGIEKHGKRRGAVRPKGGRASGEDENRSFAAAGSERPAGERSGRALPVVVAPSTEAARPERGTIPAAVRQAVYERDGGCCSYVASDGRRCGSKWKLEFDHVLPAFLGGPSTVENVRLLCRSHNVHHAEQVFGLEHMERFRRRYGVEGSAEPER